MGRLSPGKHHQISGFFGNPKKVTKLVNKKLANPSGQYDFEKPPMWDRGNVERFVANSNIDGKPRIVKYADREDIQRFNLAMIAREHMKAARKGKIKATLYNLSIVKYRFANEKAGVMERSPGAGVDSLINVLSRKTTGLTRRQLNEAHTFLNAHPDVRAIQLFEAKFQLLQNLRHIYSHTAVFSYDLTGNDNVLARDYDPKTGKFDFVLLDQLHPEDIAQASAAFDNLKKRKSKQ